MYLCLKRIYHEQYQQETFHLRPGCPNHYWTNYPYCYGFAGAQAEQRTPSFPDCLADSLSDVPANAFFSVQDQTEKPHFIGYSHFVDSFRCFVHSRLFAYSTHY